MFEIVWACVGGTEETRLILKTIEREDGDRQNELEPKKTENLDPNGRKFVSWQLEREASQFWNEKERQGKQ